MTHPRFTLREGHPEDLDAVIELDRNCESAPHWPPTTYASALEQAGTLGPQRCLIVADSQPAQSPRLAGFAVAALQRVPPEITAELEDVIVAPDLRRTGIGRALCQAAIEWAHAHGATSITLEVRAGSTGAIALYTALGFRQLGCRPGYYSDPGDDAILMELSTSPPDPSSSPG